MLVEREWLMGEFMANDKKRSKDLWGKIKDGSSFD
jgi:hypothetical protein